MSEIADILDRAADLIEPEGAWTQNEFRRANGALCALAAMSEACQQFSFADNSKVLQALRTAFGRPYICDWNDAPERTQAEVVAKLREAAAKARAQS